MGPEPPTLPPPVALPGPHFVCSPPTFTADAAFRAARQLLDSHYSPDEWNIYLFHFSDGDNSSEADSRDCVKLLKEQLLPVANMFGYCQVASAYGSGNFINVLHEHLRGHEKVLTSRVNSKDDIYDSIKTFFGKGH